MKTIIQKINLNILGLVFSIGMILTGITYYMYTNDISGSMVLMTVGLTTAVMFAALVVTRPQDANLVSP